MPLGAFIGGQIVEKLSDMEVSCNIGKKKLYSVKYAVVDQQHLSYQSVVGQLLAPLYPGSATIAQR